MYAIVRQRMTHAVEAATALSAVIAGPAGVRAGVTGT
jgi:hypothetical protein